MFGVVLAAAQDTPPSNPGSAPPQEGQVRVHQGQEGGPRLFGKITAIKDGVIEISRPDGQTVSVKVTGETEFRKDRSAAKISDFKVGDMVIVRGDENPDHTVTAKMIGGRTGAGGMMYGGPGGGPGGRPGGMTTGTLGKDYVVGEVKSIDPPRITVLRTDNVTQTLELNEDTTLRKGRESVTMADIQVGDHVMAHGAVQNNVFVPKGVMVMSPEQWQRMQESQANGTKTANPDAKVPNQ